MKFGMNLLLWTADVTEEYREVLEQLKAIGYDGVEIPMFETDEAKFAKLGTMLDALGLARTAVTVRTAEDNPISPDAAIRAKGVAGNLAALDSCAALGATTLVGPFHSALGEFSGSGPSTDEWKWGVESMQKVAEHAAQVNVKLAIEPLNRFECYFLNTAEDAARFAREVAHPSCGILYDTFHANIEEKSISAAIKNCQDVLAHVHISENDRSTPGQGGVDWKTNFATLKTLDYDAWMTVEAFGLAIPEIAAATKIWRRMYNTEMQLAEDALAFMKKSMA